MKRDETIGPFQRGEIAVGIAVGTVCLVAGAWMGLWMVPEQALSVPIETSRYGGSRPAFQPVPTFAPFMTVVTLATGGYAAYRSLHPPDPEDAAQEVESDA